MKEHVTKQQRQTAWCDGIRRVNSTESGFKVCLVVCVCDAVTPQTECNYPKIWQMVIFTHTPGAHILRHKHRQLLFYSFRAALVLCLWHFESESAALFLFSAVISLWYLRYNLHLAKG